MRRPATFTILTAVLVTVSITGCAGSSRQAESAAVTAEQPPELSADEQYAAARRELRAALAAGTITEEQAE